ncbi:lactonase family protein [Aquimarina sp. ERC-38]|uniref:lactonase family protein n=1 Tax=Aquimarina sp. ERC-38 TaxID=2949996 RepID=UPI002245F82F|nr:lactonase family protein [Aquimarina sp. ERC-38]UZO80793.1 lactonase family protein [Aquimarina sp. ERC-38]
MHIYIGSYTDGHPDRGIYVYQFNIRENSLQEIQVIDDLVNPSFLKFNKNKTILFSVSESQGDTPGKIASFRRDINSGKLSLISTVDSGGRNPVHLALNQEETYLANSNYTDPGLTLYSVAKNGGLQLYTQKITFDQPGSNVVKNRQKQAHIHSSNFTPDQKYLLVQDLGRDRIYSLQFKPNYQKPLVLQPEKEFIAKPGAGPRHFTFHPDGNFAYGVAELNGMVSQFNYKDGELEFIEDILSYQQEQDLYRTADIHCSPDGKFLYVSNRGPKEDTVAIFAINQENGKLTIIGHIPTYGVHPRNFGISSSGDLLIVANQFSNNVTFFRRNATTGLLQKLEDEIQVQAPSCIEIVEID